MFTHIDGSVITNLNPMRKPHLFFKIKTSESQYAYEIKMCIKI